MTESETTLAACPQNGIDFRSQMRSLDAQADIPPDEVKRLAQNIIRSAALTAIQASVNRDDAICAAHKLGISIRPIAAAAGLSSARVHQILHSR